MKSAIWLGPWFFPPVGKQYLFDISRWLKSRSRLQSYVPAIWNVFVHRTNLIDFFYRVHYALGSFSQIFFHLRHIWYKFFNILFNIYLFFR